METFAKMCIRTTLHLSLLYLLVWTPFCSAFPTSVSLRSSSTNTDGQITLGVGILRDVMMMRSDANRDGKLSASEIESFYRQFYPTYVARMYGQEFIRIADTDHDGLLDQHELLQMLIAIDALSMTRR